MTSALHVCALLGTMLGPLPGSATRAWIVRGLGMTDYVILTYFLVLNSFYALLLICASTPLG